MPIRTNMIDTGGPIITATPRIHPAHGPHSAYAPFSNSKIYSFHRLEPRGKKRITSCRQFVPFSVLNNQLPITDNQ